MTTTVKINAQKLKFALLKEGYSSIEEFAKKAKMTHSTITNAMNTGECSYKTAFKIIDALGVDAEVCIINE